MNLNESNLRTFVSFLLRLCAIVGGVYATSSMVNNVVQFCVRMVASRPSSSPHSNGLNGQTLPESPGFSPSEREAFLKNSLVH